MLACRAFPPEALPVIATHQLAMAVHAQHATPLPVHRCEFLKELNMPLQGCPLSLASNAQLTIHLKRRWVHPEWACSDAMQCCRVCLHNGSPSLIHPSTQPQLRPKMCALRSGARHLTSPPQGAAALAALPLMRSPGNACLPQHPP